MHVHIFHISDLLEWIPQPRPSESLDNKGSKYHKQQRLKENSKQCSQELKQESCLSAPKQRENIDKGNRHPSAHQPLVSFERISQHHLHIPTPLNHNAPLRLNLYQRIPPPQNLSTNTPIPRAPPRRYNLLIRLVASPLIKNQR